MSHIRHERRLLNNANLLINEEPDVPRVERQAATVGYQQLPEVGNNPPLPNNGGNKRSKCRILQASLTVVLLVTTVAMIISFGVISSHFQSVMKDMSERINSPGRLYESCHQESNSCSLPQASGFDYWMYCATRDLIINETVGGYNIL